MNYLVIIITTKVQYNRIIANKIPLMIYYNLNNYNIIFIFWFLLLLNIIFFILQYDCNYNIYLGMYYTLNNNK